MPLELSTEHGEPTEIKVGGKVLPGVKLVSIEAEPGMTTVHIEMEPSFTAKLEEGQIHWMVCCPNCEHNSVHTCEIDDAAEPEQRALEWPQVVAVPDPTFADPARVVHLRNPE